MRVIQSIVNQGHGSCSPTYLFVHSTANPGATAKNHRDLYSRGYDYAVQYVGDWTGDVYHCVPDNRLAWAVGNGNPYGVSYEMCEGTNKAQFDKTWQTAVDFCAWYLKQRGWGIDRLMSHDEARRKWGGTDHTDPIPYFAKWGKTWNDFKKAVKKAMQTPWQGAGTYRITKNALIVRNAPSMGAGTHVTTWKKGQKAKIDKAKTVDGYVWGHFIGPKSSKDRWLCLGSSDGKKTYMQKV